MCRSYCLLKSQKFSFCLSAFWNNNVKKFQIIDRKEIWKKCGKLHWIMLSDQQKYSELFVAKKYWKFFIGHHYPHRHLQARAQWWPISSWWCHQMETFSALLALCVGNSRIIWWIFSQRPMTQSFDVFFDLRLNERLSKQSWGWWFETPSRPLWRHCNDVPYSHKMKTWSMNTLKP